MKNQILALIGMALFTFNSCSVDESGDIIPAASEEALSGNIFENRTLDASVEYNLNGALVVNSGVTLTIPAGTKIKAVAGGTGVFIAVLKGGKIVADGTSTNPIVISSDNGTPGDWGGLLICGNAPINSGDANGESIAEVGGFRYGGNNVSDNSGSYNYVVLRGTGAAVNSESEFNGFSFYGVGNGTTVENITVQNGADDGLEFFGGTVHVTNVYLENCQDDSLDWTEGFQGSVTNAFVKQHAGNDKVIEADGNENNHYAMPYSNPTITNLTVVGLGATEGLEAIRLRRGTQAQFHNVNLYGYGEGFDLDDDATIAHAQNGDINISGIQFTDVTTKLKDFPTTQYVSETSVTPIDPNVWTWKSANF